MRLSEVFANDEVVVNPYSGREMTYAEARASNYSSGTASDVPCWLVELELRKAKEQAQGLGKAPG